MAKQTTKRTGLLFTNTIQCCGSGTFIPILIFVHLGSRISAPGSKNSNKRGKWKKICCPTFFCSNKYHKIENYFIFELVRKKIWPNLQRIIKLYTQKIVIKFSKILVWDPGSGKTYSGFRILGSKAPDPGSGSAKLIRALKKGSTIQQNQSFKLEIVAKWLEIRTEPNKQLSRKKTVKL